MNKLCPECGSEIKTCCQIATEENAVHSCGQSEWVCKCGHREYVKVEFKVSMADGLAYCPKCGELVEFFMPDEVRCPRCGVIKSKNLRFPEVKK